MAATLSLLKLPILPCNYNKARHTTRPVPLPPLSAKLNSNSNTPKDFPTPQKFLDHNFNALKNTSLSLTAITFPFLLEPKASNATIYFSFLIIISHAFFSLFFLYSHEINFLWVAQDALAAGGEFGIFEGRTFALIHPIVLAGLFFYTLYAGYLGWQWRRVRTIQNEINELKKQIKPAPVTPDGKPVETSPSPVELKVQQLTEVGTTITTCVAEA